MQSVSNISNELWTREEAARFLKVSPKCLANWGTLGVGPKFRKLSKGRSGRVLYRASDVTAWLESKTERGNEREAA